MNNNVVIVGNGDDWEGLYICDELFVEGHKLTAKDILQAFKISYEEKTTAKGWLENIGSLPYDISDVVFDE